MVFAGDPAGHDRLIEAVLPAVCVLENSILLELCWNCLMPLCLIGLGSNLGDRSGWLDEALARLQRHPDIEVTRQSRYHETLPVGGPARSRPI